MDEEQDWILTIASTDVHDLRDSAEVNCACLVNRMGSRQLQKALDNFPARKWIFVACHCAIVRGPDYGSVGWTHQGSLSGTHFSSFGVSRAI